MLKKNWLKKIYNLDEYEKNVANKIVDEMRKNSEECKKFVVYIEIIEKKKHC